MAIYQVETETTAEGNSPRARRFTVNAPNEVWAHEYAARRAGYADGYDGYLRARESDTATPALRVRLIPTLTDKVA